MFCGEREQGTLRMVLGTGISRGQLALGKLLGLTIPLAAVLVPAMVVGILALAFFGGPDSGLWSWPRVVVLMLIYLAYFAVFVGGSLVVSALASSSRFALVLLTGFWFLTSFVMPRLVVDGVERVTPLPTVAEFETAIAKDIEALISWPDRTERVTQRLMEEHGVDKVEDLPFDPDGFVLLEAEEDETRVYRKHFDALTASYARQVKHYQVGGLFAPLVALRSLSMAVAGTDYGHHREFAEAAEAYRFNYVQELNTHLAENMKPGERYLAGQSLWESVEAFSYQPPTLSRILGEQWISLVFLGVWALAVVIAVPLALKRMRAF
jgi:ABC-2 type transport system permease protein